jgi:Universal stress protein UspA and related nucleotide-binding proteins
VAALSIWAASRLSVPLTLLHVLDKSSRQTEPELSGNLAAGSREQLLQELVELDGQRAKLEMRHGKVLLSELADEAKAKGLDDVSKLQRHGNLVETLLELEAQTRVLVLGKSGEVHQSDAKAIGSQLESVVRSIKAHTLIANGEFSAPDSYVLAFDGSDISEKLVEKALNTPLLAGMTCHLVMVEDSQEKLTAFKRAAERLEAVGVNVVQAQLTGEVHRAILDYQASNQVGMIVMGAYGHSKLRQFFVGSNTTKLLIESTVPMLLIR